jgi:hypothetical protein
MLSRDRTLTPPLSFTFDLFIVAALGRSEQLSRVY